MRHQSAIRRLALAGTALSLLSTVGAGPAGAAVCTWNGGAGNWATGNWDCGVPGSGDDIRIDGGKAISSLVSITDDRTANTVMLDSGDQIAISNGVLRINGGSLVNNGIVTIGAGSNLIAQSSPLTLSGTGGITLADTGAGAFLYAQNGVQMTIGSGQTVVGAGNIGANQGLLVNHGTIDATAAGTGVLTIDAQGGSNGVAGNAAFVNTGIVKATGGGTLTLASGDYENGGGAIDATGAGSTVHLNDDVRIGNGALASSSGGHIEANNGTQYLQDVTLGSGSAFGISSDTVRIDGNLGNGGTITITNGGVLAGETAVNGISGTGTIQLTDTGNGATLYTANGTTMTLGSGQSIVGSGNIGANQGVMINAGTITANGSAALTIDAQGGSNGLGSGNGVGTGTNTGFLNTGLVQATGGSTLILASGLYENAGAGAITALGGSLIHLNDDVRILNGILTSTGSGGGFEMTNGTQYLQSVTLANGTIVNINNDAVRVDGTLGNNGSIAITNGGVLLGETPTSALSGNGTVRLTDTGNGATLYNFNGTTMTIGSGQTVTGSGSIGANQGILRNDGTITATGALMIDAQGGSNGVGAGNGIGTNGNASFLNTGAIQATAGSTLTLASGLYENATGTSIQASGGSTVHLNDDVRILNGTLASGGGSQFTMTNGTQYLQDVALATGTTVGISNDTVRIDGALTNNAAITLGVNGTLLGETSSVMLGGTGTIAMTDPSATLYNFNATTMTIGNGQTVIGSGSIGVNQGILLNAGTITATGAMTIDGQGGSNGVGTGNGIGTNGNASFLTTGLVQATGGATLTFASGLYEIAAGAMIRALGGSTIHLNDDVRVLNGTLASSGAGSKFEATSGTQYLQGVTLANGTTVAVSNDAVRIDGALANNGTITLGAGATLLGETPSSSVGGSGSIVMSDPSSQIYNFNGTTMTIGSGQVITGSGSIGLNQGLIQNNGNILSTGALTIDAQGGSNGLGAGNGLGTNGDVAFLNNGQVQADNGGHSLTLASGAYENTALGAFSAGTGSTFEMANDASLVNLQSGGILNQGFYSAITTGATSTLDLRSAAANSIMTIGTGHAGLDTIVTLSGANSVIEVTPLNGGTPTTIDSTLHSIAQSGALVLADGRSFTAAGTLTNAGEIRLVNGTIAAPAGLSNSGVIDGHGAIATALANSGVVVADGGTLAARTITGAAGTIQSNAGGTLDLSGATGTSTAGMLANTGMLALGANSVLVTNDYTNAHFGSGNAFDAHADVIGSGKILAVSATQDLSGSALNGSTLNVGNVRLGGSSSTTLSITNNGTTTTLRGAVGSAAGNTVAVTGSDFVLAAGAHTTVTLSYTGTTAGSLAGQSITVANNFDNVANQTLNLAGAAYNAASASISPNPIDLGATRVGGTLTGSVTIANSAPTGAYSEALAVTGASGAGGASATSIPGLIGPGGSASAAVALSTANSGTLSGTVTYSLATDGTGTSGLAQAALASQAIAVNGKVYQAAVAQLSGTTVNFGAVRQGSAAPTAGLVVGNAATGALTDTLNTSIGALPPGLASSGPGALNGGQSGTLSFAENTATAGTKSGVAMIGFTSTDADLAPLTLASQQISFAGTVTEVAIADIFKASGAGVLTGSGTNYVLDLGSFFVSSGSSSTNFGVLNDIGNASFDELLQGMFTNGTGKGFSFAGSAFSGLAGGSSDTGNVLTFSYAGLGNGLYTDTLVFNGASHYAGLTDLTLAPITISVRAQITGAVTGAVPEPATWSMMLMGFGLIGGGIRRGKKQVRPIVVAA